MFFRIADLVVDYPGTLHYDLAVKRAVLNIDFLCVSEQIVNFVDIDAIARVRDYFIEESSFRFDWTTQN